MKLIGEGMTATIYEYSPQSIAKVYRADFPLDYINYERKLLGVVSDLNIKTARYLDFQKIEDQFAIIMNKIDGTSLFLEVLRRPFNIVSYLDSFIDAQCNIHKNTTDRLPKEKSRFNAQLLRSGLSTETIESIKLLIDRLPERENVCHGDFHFGNIICSKDGLFTIDWMNAYSGNPIGDVFRSYLMLKSPYCPLPIRGINRLFFMSFKSWVGDRYLRKSLQKNRISRTEKSMWLAVVAAVRLCDNVPNEREWLERLIDQNLLLTKFST